MACNMLAGEFRARVILAYEGILSIFFDFTTRRSPCRKRQGLINRKFYRKLNRIANICSSFIVECPRFVQFWFGLRKSLNECSVIYARYANYIRLGKRS